MTFRWASLIVVALGCSTGLGGSARAPGKLALTASSSELAFTSQQGAAPMGQLVPIELREDAPAPMVKVAYAGVSEWLSAGISGAGARRVLSVQPISHKLGPGVYRASIAVADPAGAVSPREVEVTLTVLGDSHTTCPPASTLRYVGGGNGGSEPADFGRKFFATYCTACHSASVQGASRSGAPLDLNWDGLARIQEQRHWIDAVAARDPQEAHEDMPPSFVMPPAFVPMRPTPAERALLARWIACGAP
jgi:cytochrome c5